MEMPTDLTVCAEFASADGSRGGGGSGSGSGINGESLRAPDVKRGGSTDENDDVGVGDGDLSQSTFDSTLDDGDDLRGESAPSMTLADAVRAVLLDSASGEERPAATEAERSPGPRPAGALGREAAMRETVKAAKPAKSPRPPSASTLAAALSKRRSDPTFVDGRYLWLQFSRPERISESQAAAFAREFNILAGRRLLLESRFSINASSNEAYFRLSPGTQPTDVGRLLESSRAALSSSDGGNFAWSGSGFGQPQNRVSASELSAGWSEQTRVTTTLLVCAVVMAMILALFAFFIVQRFRSSKRKLREMAASSSGACDNSDYRDLCRQRMAERSSGERTEPVSAAAAQHLARAGGSPNSSTGSWSDDPIDTDMDITTGHLILSYMENYLGNREKLEHEWADLCSYEAEQSASLVGATAENAAKNRYQDLLPYDHSRVVLKREQNASGGDYINASYIYDSDPKVKAYILTQGPTSDTSADFWQMLWESASVTVVNLTGLQTADGSVELCAQYWPREGARLFNKFEVHLVSEHVWCEDFIVRNFYLKNLGTGEARTVTMFHFLSWDEAGLPRSAKALLDFRRKVNKSYKGRATPLVVHCSDGCGRSGTYCLLDLALTRIGKGVKEIDLAASLEHLRDQRPGLVKTRDQFEFVVAAIADEVHTVLKTLPQK